MTSMLDKTILSSEQQVKFYIYFFDTGALTTRLIPLKEFVNLISICGNELLIHVDNILDFMKIQDKKIQLKVIKTI